MINSKITFRFLLFFQFLLGAHAGLTVTPGDLVVPTGASALFNCSTNSGARVIPNIRTAYINWCNSASTQCGNLVNNDPNVVVYFNDFNGNFPSSRYSIDLYDTSSSERARNLRIPQTRLTDAGNYVCYDVNAAVTATAKLTVIDRPSCMGTTNGSYVALTCNVTYSGSGDNVRVVLQQNGQTIVNGTANVNTVTWSGNLANTSGLTCTVYSGISSSCTILNDSPPTTTTQSLTSSSSAPAVASSSPSTNATVPTSSSTLLPTTTIIIIACSIGGAALVIVIVLVAYFNLRPSTNPSFAPQPKSDSFPTDFVGLSRRTEVGSRPPDADVNFQRSQFQNSAYLNAGYHGYGQDGHGHVARATNYHYYPSDDVPDQYVAKAYNRSLY